LRAHQRNRLAHRVSVCDISLAPAGDTRDIQPDPWLACLLDHISICSKTRQSEQTLGTGHGFLLAVRHGALYCKPVHLLARQSFQQQTFVWNVLDRTTINKGSVSVPRIFVCVCLDGLFCFWKRRCFMSQYRPLKDDNGQAAAQAVATRDHWSMKRFIKTLLEL
jgi:hypothetical protein